MKYFESRKERVGGDLTIKGTRIRIAQVINMLANGYAKHIKHDVHHGGMDDGAIHDLAVKQGRINLSSNVKHFRPLVRDDSLGFIGIPETWSTSRLDKKLTALLMSAGPNFFRGRYRSLDAVDEKRQAA